MYANLHVYDHHQEDDLQEQMAPDSAVKEEHRLRAEREAAEANEVVLRWMYIRAQPMAISHQPQVHTTEAVMDKNKFSRLERLIFRATQYSAFLGEQMQYVEEQTLNEIATDTNVNKKRKTAKGKKQADEDEENKAIQAAVQVYCGGGYTWWWYTLWYR